MIGSTVGDLRAIFLDLNGLEVAEADLYITDAADVYDDVSGEGDIDKISKDANIKGSVSNELCDFDLRIEFGTSGMSQDDIQSTTFTLGSLSGPLTLDMLSFADFGLRYTSVGTGEDRNASAKIGDTTGGVADNYALDVSENESSSVNLLANDSATGRRGSADRNVKHGGRGLWHADHCGRRHGNRDRGWPGGGRDERWRYRAVRGGVYGRRR